MHAEHGRHQTGFFQIRVHARREVGHIHSTKHSKILHPDQPALVRSSATLHENLEICNLSTRRLCKIRLLLLGGTNRWGTALDRLLVMSWNPFALSYWRALQTLMNLACGFCVSSVIYHTIEYIWPKCIIWFSSDTMTKLLFRYDRHRSCSKQGSICMCYAFWDDDSFSHRFSISFYLFYILLPFIFLLFSCLIT